MADSTTDKSAFSFSFSIGHHPDTETLMEEKNALLEKVAAIDKKITKKKNTMRRRSALGIDLLRSKKALAACERRVMAVKKKVDAQNAVMSTLKRDLATADDAYVHASRIFTACAVEAAAESGQSRRQRQADGFFEKSSIWHWCRHCTQYSVKSLRHEDHCVICDKLIE